MSIESQLVEMIASSLAKAEKAFVKDFVGDGRENGQNRTLSRLGLSAFPVPLLPIRDLGSNGTKTQRRPAANVQLKYTSTGRQSAHWHRVRLGPLSALSDA